MLPRFHDEIMPFLWGRGPAGKSQKCAVHFIYFNTLIQPFKTNALHEATLPALFKFSSRIPGALFQRKIKGTVVWVAQRSLNLVPRVSLLRFSAGRRETLGTRLWVAVNDSNPMSLFFIYLMHTNYSPIHGRSSSSNTSTSHRN